MDPLKLTLLFALIAALCAPMVLAIAPSLVEDVSVFLQGVNVGGGNKGPFEQTGSSD